MSNSERPRITADELTMPWGKGRRIRAEYRTCATCSESFLTPASMTRRYCSKACYHARPTTARRYDCEQCGQSFAPTERTARFCSRACYQAHGCGPAPKERCEQHRRRTEHGHPLTPPSGTVAVSRLVLYDKIGPGEHPCHWCQTPVHWIVGGGPATPGSLLADHVDWDINNNAAENLVPSCNRCNAHRTKNGGRAPIQPDELTMPWGGRLTRAVQRDCVTCGTGFLTIPAEIRKGKGLYCSRSCARRRPRG